MVCKKVHVDRPSWAVSGGQCDLSFSSSTGAGADFDLLDPPAIAANAPRALAVELPEEFEEDAGETFFTLAQSCHELHTLHTLPFSSRIRPGGKLGWVSFVVRRGLFGVDEVAMEPAGVEGSAMAIVLRGKMLKCIVEMRNTSLVGRRQLVAWS